MIGGKHSMASINRVPIAVDAATTIGDGDAKQRAEHQTYRDRGDTHGKREPRAVHDAAQDVASEQIATEPVFGGHRGEPPALAGGVPVVGRQQRCQRRKRKNGSENDGAGNGTRRAKQPRNAGADHACTRGSMMP